MTISGPATDFQRATRDSYDALAPAYVEFARGELAAKPLERALLGTFAELAAASGGGLPVADVGCGTGRVTEYLHGLGRGLDVFGVDLSPRMLAVARQEHPGLRFEEGSMLALDLPDTSLGGLLAWYSTIHVPDEELPRVFAEFHRVLAPGAHVQLGFQVGDEPLRMTEALGAEISSSSTGGSRRGSPNCCGTRAWRWCPGCGGSGRRTGRSRSGRRRGSCWRGGRTRSDPG